MNSALSCRIGPASSDSDRDRRPVVDLRQPVGRAPSRRRNEPVDKLQVLEQNGRKPSSDFRLSWGCRGDGPRGEQARASSNRWPEAVGRARLDFRRAEAPDEWRQWARAGPGGASSLAVVVVVVVVVVVIVVVVAGHLLRPTRRRLLVGAHSERRAAATGSAQPVGLLPPGPAHLLLGQAQVGPAAAGPGKGGGGPRRL